MQRYIAVLIRQGVRYQRELDLVGVQLAFVGAARLIEFVVQVAAVGVFLGGENRCRNPRPFDCAILAVGVAVVIIGELGQIAEFVKVSQAVEIHDQVIFAVFDGQLNGVVDGVVGHGFVGAVGFHHLAVNGVNAIFQIVFV